MYALTSAEMRYMDEYTISGGLSGSVLMENAARGLADEVAKRFADKSTSILVVFGYGKNGGDAVAAARWLLHFGYKNVRMYYAGPLDRISKELADQLNILIKAYPTVEIGRLRKVDQNEILHAKYDVIIDGIYGIGLNRALGTTDTGFANYINSKSAYKVAVDIPSGLNATTGIVMSAAIRADLTVTFGNYKTGMFFGAGREYCGEIKLVDIGLMESGYKDIPNKLLVCDRDYYEAGREKALRERSESGHKGTFGTVGIAVSSNGMLGASMLAARAAYRSGCGLVKIFCPSKYVGFFNVSIPEAVAVPYKSDDVIGAFEDFIEGVDAMLIGPGLREDEAGRLLVKKVLSGTVPAVLDAGALNLLSDNLKMLRKRKCPCVITPHLGELAKLCKTDVATIASNRVGIISKFSEEFDISMVAKSDVSIISLIDERGEKSLYINTVGNSGLATAGSGDVLAGVIASLIAQGNTLNNSLLYGVMTHGAAAEKFATDADEKRKMMATDIIDKLF